MRALLWCAEFTRYLGGRRGEPLTMTGRSGAGVSGLDLELDPAAGAFIYSTDDHAGDALGEAEVGGLPDVAGKIDGKGNGLVLVALDEEGALIAGADEALAECHARPIDVTGDEASGDGLIGEITDFDVVAGAAATEATGDDPQPCEPSEACGHTEV